MADPAAEGFVPTPEQAILEVQRIAAICGEFGFAGAHDIVQFRATFPPFAERGDAGPTVIAVPAEKVDGIFEAIWRRLRERPEWEPVKAAELETQKVSLMLGKAQDELDIAAKTARIQARVIAELRHALAAGPDAAALHYPRLAQLLAIYSPEAGSP